MSVPAAATEVPPLENLEAVDAAMHRLILAQTDHERGVGERDREIQVISNRFRGPITKAESAIAVYTAQIEQYCRTHPEEMEPGKKSIQLRNGRMGLRDSPAPPLVPVSDKWTPARIREKIIELWGNRKFFHKPKPPSLDMVKLKTLTDAELKQAGLKRDENPLFYLELNRPDAAEAVTVQIDAA